MEEYLKLVIAVLISSVIAIRSYRRNSLDISGAFAGFLVMSAHIAAGYRHGALLLVFFFTSSKLTKIGEDKKRSIDADFKQGGQRNWIQVLANSGISMLLVVVLGILTGWKDKCLDSKDSGVVTFLIAGIIGHYACCNGDTWSSEIGMLSNSQPRLITTFKPVRRGTNGAVTTTGLLAAAAAGSVIGLTFVLAGLFTTKCSSDEAVKQLLVIPLAAMAGLCGSLIDSLLGATMQFSGFCSVRNKEHRTSSSSKARPSNIRMSRSSRNSNRPQTNKRKDNPFPRVAYGRARSRTYLDYMVHPCLSHALSVSLSSGLL